MGTVGPGDDEAKGGIQHESTGASWRTCTASSRSRQNRQAGPAVPASGVRALLDPGSFVEIGGLVRKPGKADAMYGDGVVTGHGRIDGRPVVVVAHAEPRPLPYRSLWHSSPAQPITVDPAPGAGRPAHPEMPRPRSPSDRPDRRRPAGPHRSAAIRQSA
jgi:Carboxyl transferase domain